MRRDPPVGATMLLATLLLVATGALAVWAGGAAMAFLPGLDVRNPPLAGLPLDPGPKPPPPRLARKVVLVMIDGLRIDASYGRPFLDGLRRQGIDASATVGFPSLSYPGYVALVTGVPARASGVRGNSYPWEVGVDTVMARAHAAGLHVAYVSPGGDGLPRMFPAGFDAGGVAPWPGGFEQLGRYALDRGEDLIMLWLLDVDNAGHRHGGASPEYRQAARDVDVMLGELLGDLDLSKDTIIVTADHGHIDSGGHGGLEPEVLEVPLILAGAGIRPGVTLVDVQQIDIAPTVAALLGLPPPGHALGRVVSEALSFDAETATRLAGADRARVTRLEATLGESSAAARARGEALSTRRGVIAGLVIAGMLGLTVVAARRHWVLIDRRVLLVALPAFPLTFYSMVVTFENYLSPSLLPERSDVPSKLFGYGALAALCHIAAALGTLGGRPAPWERLAAATGMALTGLLVALVPLGLAWKLASPTLVQELPSPSVLMLPPTVYVAVAAYAASALATLLVEYAVFMARSTR